jgi:hypothetical protein
VLACLLGCDCCGWKRRHFAVCMARQGLRGCSAARVCYAAVWNCVSGVHRCLSCLPSCACPCPAMPCRWGPTWAQWRQLTHWTSSLPTAPATSSTSTGCGRWVALVALCDVWLVGNAGGRAGAPRQGHVCLPAQRGVLTQGCLRFACASHSALQSAAAQQRLRPDGFLVPTSRLAQHR